MNIAFLGLGGMGHPMARNLLKAGYDVSVWNRTQSVAETLVSEGASVLTAPSAAADCDIVISMLADDNATRDVLFSQNVLTTLKPGALVINMATISVSLIRELTEICPDRHLFFINAPVLGRVEVADAGNLNILASGDGQQIDRAQPLFDVMGQKTWRFGDKPENACAAKLATNFVLASAIEALGESCALVESHDINASDFIAMLTGTLFSAPAYKGYGAMVAEERYTPVGFKLTLGLKDMLLVQQAAEKKNVPMPFASVMRDNYLEAIAGGDGDLDWSALGNVTRKRSRLR
ncbi:NAD(P)-dependent oxidoreductase [Enterobacter sp. Cy-643]|uniref:NAD(P)-dependent oxidoreductase n=1 Tax=Enterobacter sp. Cy-643 TaxID=2608346 RepID=UPI001421BC0C|nr:NAD(P)-dependent oxidoreductase [Enterobacter sp. Cy-643]NIF30848.1 NAD(P)-dependent oxidoreductase [Enterobacter sp. Cy-643]